MNAVGGGSKAPAPARAPDPPAHAELDRLAEDAARTLNWKRWGPYLSERQWGTVREDYSADGTSWDFLPHDHARSRAYRWGEDGLLGITDRECRLSFALALWNGRDPILKERLFGLTGEEGSHGEDVKECYFFLDSTPTHSYMKALYKYPQAEFPYARLVEENRRRGKESREYELLDTGIFDDDRYFDVFVEYAKASPDDTLIRLTVANRGPDAATLHLLPTLWSRNTWSWGRTGPEYPPRPRLWQEGPRTIRAEHASLGTFELVLDAPPDGRDPELFFTENETNSERLFGIANPTPHVKDAFHAYVVEGKRDAVNPERTGSKAAAHLVLEIPAGGEVVLRLRLRGVVPNGAEEAFGPAFDATFDLRLREADAFYARHTHAALDEDERRIVRQCYAGLLWSKQFYHYVVTEWLAGDPGAPTPPPERRDGRNHDWGHLHNRDVISMPDTWEYPWYAAWDLAFHMVAMANIDPEYAKEQLVLFLREWYMHPNGQLPAYEWALGDVNPPVHAWAAWRVYKVSGKPGARDRRFLERVFQKLVINFTWWINRKDEDGNHIFSGGFLGLDNIGVFDRSKPLPTGGHLEQADGTAWMAAYCGTMLSIALELAREDPVYEDIASTFFEHFIAITDAMNALGGTGLWDDADGFYYDQLHVDGQHVPLKLRSMVGLIPLFAVEVLEQETLDRLPGFSKRMRWFIENRADLARHIAYLDTLPEDGHVHRLLAIPSRERLVRVLRYLLDEREFLSPHGVRALSRIHLDAPYVFAFDGMSHEVRYAPGESTTGLFGGNSNWRGPVWFPVNYLLIESLERYHHFYGETLRVECPTGSGQVMNLLEVARELSGRLSRLFLRDADGRRPCNGDSTRFANDPHWKDLVLFHEYFHGDDGRGLGASHQTGWTALAARCLLKAAHAGRLHPAPEASLPEQPTAEAR
jgi:Glycosyl hydrolase family 63 C-terminal domain